MNKNAFEEFNTDGVSQSVLNPEPPQKFIMGLMTASRNPFSEFGDLSDQTTIPLDAILSAHASAMDRLTEAYKQLIAECLGEGVWQPNRDAIIHTYEVACRLVVALEWTIADVEVFCVHALQSDDPAFLVRDPLCLFLSAFFNASSNDNFKLDLTGQNLRLPLMGYRLRAGLKLTVIGNLGDLTGLSLEGGHLYVVGSVRSHLGAGMKSGRIDVSEDAGRFVGEQMTGGEIHVEGRLGGLGNPKGGQVYHHKQIIFGQ